MGKIKVLDCTLRDGGYCNQWRFGKKNILAMIRGLLAANVDFIECGFLTNRVVYSEDVTKYTALEQLSEFISKKDTGKPCVVMVNYGEYDVENIPNCEETTINGIRVAFHKKNWQEAIEYCKKLKEKGYMVFVQPMVSMSYTEEEFTTLIHEVNMFEPYAFYIVDSFGMMNRKKLLQLVDIVEWNLKDSVALGFHAHNNLQLAYSNAQDLVDLPMERERIIDVSIHGMGRGAGNLNAELFLNCLNETIESNYVIRPILNLMDEVVSRFYEEKPWGYSLPNYLSAAYMIHPNYAKYLNEKKTLTLEAIDEIFSMIDSERGLEYDEAYIEDLYVKFLSNGRTKSSHLNELSDRIFGKKVLLIAPGRSTLNEKNKILSFIETQHPVVFSINHDYPYVETDYIFVSNMRRFRQLSSKVYAKTIATSNIPSEETYASIEYYKYLNTVDGVRDNAGLMAIRFLAECGATEIYIAGLDGYTYDQYNNFETRDMTTLNSIEFMDKMNYGMVQVLNSYVKKYQIYFLTESLIAPKI